MHLQQMLRQDRVTLKKDTLPHTQNRHTSTRRHSSTLTQARQRERQRGRFIFQEAFCAHLRAGTIERGEQEQEEGQRLRERGRVRARGELVGESGWERATERGRGRKARRVGGVSYVG